MIGPSFSKLSQKDNFIQGHDGDVKECCKLMVTACIIDLAHCVVIHGWMKLTCHLPYTTNSTHHRCLQPTITFTLKCLMVTACNNGHTCSCHVVNNGCNSAVLYVHVYNETTRDVTSLHTTFSISVGSTYQLPTIITFKAKYFNLKHSINL